MSHGIEDLTRLAEEVLGREGVPVDQAFLVAQALVEADARGIHTHGLARLPTYVRAVQEGGIAAAPEMKWSRERPSSVVLDAGRGFGQVAMHHAVSKGAELASSSGVAAVSVQRSTHYGAGAIWVDRLGRDGFASILISTTGACAVPFGGSERFLGANPLTIGIPSTDDTIILDMATSATAYGAVFNAYREGRDIPSDWAVDADGEPTTDPKAALRGALRTFGGYKGSGLSVMIELLVGSIAGGNFSADVEDIQGKADATMEAGHLLIILGGDLGADDAPLRASRFAERARDVRPSADGPVLVPGERELASRHESLEVGVELPAWIEESLRELASGHGMDMPKSLG